MIPQEEVAETVIHPTIDPTPTTDIETPVDTSTPDIVPNGISALSTVNDCPRWYYPARQVAEDGENVCVECVTDSDNPNCKGFSDSQQASSWVPTMAASIGTVGLSLGVVFVLVSGFSRTLVSLLTAHDNRFRAVSADISCIKVSRAFA